MTVKRSALRRVWDERDDRYPTRRYELTEDQIDGVRSYRLSEAAAAGDPTLMLEAQSWRPPKMRTSR